MATKKKKKTKAPEGLSITRSGAAFAAEWKIGDKDYDDGQAFQYRTKESGKNTAWKSISIGKTKTKQRIPGANQSFDLTKYFPNTGKPTLDAVEFRVQGNRKKYSEGSGSKKKDYNPTVSEWTPKSFTIKAPDAPGLSAEWDKDHYNVTTFSWQAKDDSHKWFTGVVWQTILVKDCNVTDGSKLTCWKSSQTGWATNTGSASGSQTFTESTSTLASGSYTRWFRVKARGPAGDSGWVYKNHVYAVPRVPIVGHQHPVSYQGSGYAFQVSFATPSDVAHPIDKVVVEYKIAVPDAGRTCPTGGSWTESAVSADTGGTEKAIVTTDTRPADDECLWVRVRSVHDTRDAASDPKFITGLILKEPDNVSVQTDSTTHQATITADNTSTVPDSLLAVKYISDSEPDGFWIGFIPHGSTSVTVQCPAWASGEQVAFAVMAMVGDTSRSVVRPDGITEYGPKTLMASHTITDGGTVPLAPASVGVEATDIPGTIRVTFDWTWTDATAAELSWADHADAWESTDEPDTYMIRRINAGQWNISGLETGVRWYVRVRLVSGSGDDATYGDYSETVEIDLASAPAIPVLALSDGVITADGSVTASWAYSTTDGTLQGAATVAELVSGEYVDLAHVAGAQHVTISAEDAGWSAGETHLLAVRVMSGSGKLSDDWSDPVAVTIAERLTASITADSLEPQTIVVDGLSRNINALTELPLSITVTGAGPGGTTSVIIERAAAYSMARPDESVLFNPEGEAVALVTQTGEGTIYIGSDNLIGDFDDGAAYRIIATVQDGLGQSAEVTKDFEVHWAHQAIIPDATVEIDSDAMIAKLTPVAPTGALSTDRCDIYRLSVDKPVLIYPGAEFGTTYVDPFPTIGEYGGHRFVFRTANGDYITASEELAWKDTGEDDGDLLEAVENIIDFGAGRVELTYEIDLSNSWAKDFSETQYLGGSVQGDWNPAVSRSTSVSAVGVTADDQETIQAMRRLAEHPGICHIRTRDGSSFAADVQVTENYKQSNDQKLVYFSLKITRVDPETYDGLTLAEWEQTQQEEE